MSSLVKHKSYWWAKKDPLNYCVVTLWKLLRRVRLLAAPWTIPSVESSQSEYWSGEPIPSPGDLPDPGIELESPALQVDSLPAEPPGKPKSPKWLL